VFNRIVELKSTYELGAAPKGASSTEARREVKSSAEHANSAVDATIAVDEATIAVAAPTLPRPSIDRVAAREADTRLAARYDALVSELGIPVELADVIAESHETADFFDAALAEHDDAGGVAGWMVNDLRGLAADTPIEELPFGGSALGRLARLVADDTVSRVAAKDVLARMVEEGGDPRRLVEEMGLEKVSDADALGPIVDRILAEWAEKVEEYRDGNANLIGLFVGQVMRASGGAADPKAARAMLEDRLGS